MIGKSSSHAFDQVAVGDALPELTLPSIDRTTLALFAGASGDRNPVHIDIDFARSVGMPDVFAHGMLGMAWLGRLVTGWIPQAQMRAIDVRFVDIIHLGNIITCSGKIVEKIENPGDRRVRIDLVSRNQFGQTKLTGDALVALP